MTEFRMLMPAWYIYTSYSIALLVSNEWIVANMLFSNTEIISFL